MAVTVAHAGHKSQVKSQSPTYAGPRLRTDGAHGAMRLSRDSAAFTTASKSAICRFWGSNATPCIHRRCAH